MYKKLVSFSKWLILFSLFCLAVFLTSCNSQKRMNRLCAKCVAKEIVKDSTNTTVTNNYYDSLLYYKNRTAKPIIVDGNCDSLVKLLATHNNTLVSVDNGIKTSVIKTNKGFIFKCETDSLKQLVQLLKQKIETNTIKTIEKTIEVPVYCDKKHLDWWDKILIVCGKIFVFLAFGVAIYFGFKLGILKRL